MQQACVQVDLYDDYCLVSLHVFLTLLPGALADIRSLPNSVDYNGVVPEKWDAVKLSHLVDAEYGNQGIDFKLVPREGFGWTNCELSIGLHQKGHVVDMVLGGVQLHSRSVCISSPLE